MFELCRHAEHSWCRLYLYSIIQTLPPIGVYFSINDALFNEVINKQITRIEAIQPTPVHHSENESLWLIWMDFIPYFSPNKRYKKRPEANLFDFLCKSAMVSVFYVSEVWTTIRLQPIAPN